MEEAEAQVGELLGAEPLELGGRRGGDDPLGALDEGAHHVRLPAGRDLGPEPLVDAGALEGARPDQLGDDRGPPGGSSRSSGLVEVAVEQHRRGAGNRRRGHDEHVGVVALAAQHVALLDAEAVLLVDDHDPEGGELDALLEERVGADHDVDLAAVEPGREAAPLRGGDRLVSSATRTGRSPSSDPVAGTVREPRRRAASTGAARRAPRSGP